MRLNWHPFTQIAVWNGSRKVSWSLILHLVMLLPQDSILTFENSIKSVYVDQALEHSALFSGPGFSWLPG